MIGAALAVVVGAGSAFAAGAFNTYTASLTFRPSKAGSRRSPVPVGYTQEFTASGTHGNRPAVTLRITAKVYGLKTDLNDFPTCSPSVIDEVPMDTHCPQDAMIASGSVKALLASISNPSTSGLALPCNMVLHVWNGGNNTLWFYFLIDATHTCVVAHTGRLPPFAGTVSYQGKYEVLDVSIPASVTNPFPGLEGELVSEQLVWVTRTEKINGKTVAEVATVGCKHRRRPYSVTFVSTRNAVDHTDTITGSTKCT